MEVICRESFPSVGPGENLYELNEHASLLALALPFASLEGANHKRGFVRRVGRESVDPELASCPGIRRAGRSYTVERSLCRF